MELPGEKLLLKLWETLSEKGIGSLLAPWQIIREGSARIEVRRRELLILAQAERQARDIRAGRAQLLHDGSLKALPPPAQDLQTNVIERIGGTVPLPALINRSAADRTAEDIQRQVNIHRAVLHAEEKLADDPQEPAARKMEDDWLYTWRDYAARVSTEELQQLWGGILAGEVKSPGSFSLRTLDFLKSISRSEAENISLLAKFAIGRWIFRGNKEFLEREGVTFDLLLEMQDLGILSGVESIGISTSWKSSVTTSFNEALRSNGKVLILKHDDPNKVATMPTYMLTAIGRQILGLGTFQPHDEYLRLVGEHLKQQGFEVYFADWKQVTEDTGRSFNEQKL